MYGNPSSTVMVSYLEWVRDNEELLYPDAAAAACAAAAWAACAAWAATLTDVTGTGVSRALFAAMDSAMADGEGSSPHNGNWNGVPGVLFIPRPLDGGIHVGARTVTPYGRTGVARVFA